MKELLDDVKGLLDANPILADIQKGGGVIVLADIAQFPHQQKTPCIALVDGDGDFIRLSSKKRRAIFSLEVHVVVRHFEKTGAIVGTAYDPGLEELAKKVRVVLDMDRLSGKYMRAFLRRDGKPVLLTAGNIFLLEKLLSFEYRRIE